MAYMYDFLQDSDIGGSGQDPEFDFGTPEARKRANAIRAQKLASMNGGGQGLQTGTDLGGQANVESLPGDSGGADASKLSRMTSAAASGDTASAKTQAQSFGMNPGSAAGGASGVQPLSQDQMPQKDDVTQAGNAAAMLKLKPLFSAEAQGFGLEDSRDKAIQKLTTQPAQDPANSRDSLAAGSPQAQSGTASYGRVIDRSRSSALDPEIAKWTSAIADLDERNNSGLGVLGSYGAHGNRNYMSQRASYQQTLSALYQRQAQLRADEDREYQLTRPQMGRTEVAQDDQGAYLATQVFDPTTGLRYERGPRAPIKLQSIGAGGAWDPVTKTKIPGRDYMTHDRFGGTVILHGDGSKEVVQNPVAEQALSTTDYDATTHQPIATHLGRSATVGRPAPASASPEAQAGKALTSYDRDNATLSREEEAWRKDIYQQTMEPDLYQQRGEGLAARRAALDAQRQPLRQRLAGGTGNTRAATSGGTAPAAQPQVRQLKDGSFHKVIQVPGGWKDLGVVQGPNG